MTKREGGNRVKIFSTAPSLKIGPEKGPTHPKKGGGATLLTRQKRGGGVSLGMRRERKGGKWEEAEREASFLKAVVGCRLLNFSCAGGASSALHVYTQCCTAHYRRRQNGFNLPGREIPMSPALGFPVLEGEKCVQPSGKGCWTESAV